MSSKKKLISPVLCVIPPLFVFSKNPFRTIGSRKASTTKDRMKDCTLFNKITVTQLLKRHNNSYNFFLFVESINITFGKL